MKNSEEIKFEFTSPGTPQKNDVIEQGFATRYSIMRAVMTNAGINENLKICLWTECAATPNKLENIMVKQYKDKLSHEKFYGKMPDYAKYLRNFGEMGVVHSIATVKAKLEDLGKTCMFLGYAQNHTGGTYRMSNIRTKLIVLSNDKYG